MFILVSLISDSLFDTIRNVHIKNVTDTFCRLPVVYKKDKNTATRMMRDVNLQRVYTTINLNGLVVWSTDKGGEVTLTEKGIVDLADGYVLVNYGDAKAAGLISSTDVLAVKPAQDTVSFNGQTYEVLGIIFSGQLKDVNCVAKIHFRKIIQVEKGG